jgi:hypothetical protein
VVRHRQFDDVGGARRLGPLGFGQRRAVLAADDVGRRDFPPRRPGRRLAEHRLVLAGEAAGGRGVRAVVEVLGEPRPHQLLPDARGAVSVADVHRFAGPEVRERLADVRQERRHVDEPVDRGVVAECGDHHAAVGVSDEQRGLVGGVEQGADGLRVGVQVAARLALAAGQHRR